MDLGSLFLGLALLLLVSLIVAHPLLAGSRVRDRQPNPADALLAVREQILIQLRDLDFDHTLGKLGEDDYAAQRAQLVGQGVEVLKQLDALGLNLPAITPAAAGDELEAAIARRRQRAAPTAAAPTAPAPTASATRTCANCGRVALAGDQFCASCGQTLPTAGDPAQVQG